MENPLSLTPSQYFLFTRGTNKMIKYIKKKKEQNDDRIKYKYLYVFSPQIQ